MGVILRIASRDCNQHNTQNLAMTGAPTVVNRCVSHVALPASWTRLDGFEVSGSAFVLVPALLEQ